MAPPPRPRFGVFELDLKAGELHKHGRVVRLQEQPFQVLLMLVERRGELATREEIRRKLWPNDTVVEFDHAINTAIKKLRQALGDSAQDPKYIETVGRRGYRLMTAVQWAGAVAIDAPDSTGEHTNSEDSSAKDVTRTESMSPPGSMTGKRVSHYRVLEILGGGGMGVVYRAEDMKLGRPVALKFLPEELGNDTRTLERFDREARSASAVEHPNICPIYEFGEHEGQPFIVMQLLEGQTLRERIEVNATAGQPFGTVELLDIATQIAEGLESAHQKGIIHRDIKPANIFITNRSEVKILDFGLAKLAGDVSSLIRDPADTRPCNLNVTQTGVALGTAAYMSPEQVRGETLDGRTDLFSFGLVLYQMATGRPAFSGESMAALHAAILNHTPPMAGQLNPRLPAKLEEVINKALEKDREIRYQHAADLRADLKRIKRDITPGQMLPAPVPLAQEAPHKRPLAFAAATMVVLLIAALIASLLVRPLPPPRILSTTPITNDGRMKFTYVTDGGRMYYTTSEVGDNYKTFQVSTKGGDAVPLPDSTNGMVLADISPDRTELLFYKDLPSGGSWPLWVMPVLGGAPRRLGVLTAATFGAAWAPNGQELVYVKERELDIARIDGTGRRTLTEVAGRPSVPSWSPDSKSIRFDITDASQSVSIWQVSADGSNLHALLPNWHHKQCCGCWTADGKYYVFNSGPNIWAIREKTGLFQVARRDPVQLTAGPLEMRWPISSTDSKHLFAGGWQPRSELVRYDASSGQFHPHLGGISAEGLDFSRDGKWVVYVIYPERTLWRAKADGTQRQQLTSPPLQAGMPRWSPDAQQIAFMGTMPGKPERIYFLPSDGGVPEQVTSDAGEGGDFDPQWSPDGSSLAYGSGPYDGEDASKRVLRLIHLKSRQVSVIPGSDGLSSPRWSASGTYILALSAAGRLVLYDTHTHRQAELATGDLANLAWSQDGEFAYFAATTGNNVAFFRLRIRDRRTEQIAALTDVHSTAGTFGPWSGVAPDGSLLAQRSVGASEIYALDWDAP